MRILHLIAPVAFGGGEALLHNLLGAKREGIKEAVALIYTSRLFEEKLETLQVPVLRLSERDIGQGISKWKALVDTPRVLLLARRLTRLIRHEGIDLLHAHGYPACVLACLVTGRDAPKKIYTHHGLPDGKPQALERKFLERIYGRFDALTGVSNTVCRSMNKTFAVGNRFQPVYNCVAVQYFEQEHCSWQDGDPQGIPTSANKIRFVQVGRFTVPKNQALVVRSLAKLPSDLLAQIEVVFAGEGPTLEVAKSFVHRRGLAGNVRFLGHVPYSEVPRLLTQCNYGLLPGKREGFSIGTVECMAVGLPILAVDTDLSREIIGDKGVLVPEDQFHEGFCRILRQDFDREKIQQYARRFSPAAVKDDYIRIYREIAD